MPRTGLRLVLALCWALCASQTACGPGEAPPLRVSAWSATRALNEGITIDFSADLDPLSVTPRSVRVATLEGALPEARLEVIGPRLVVTLVLDEGSLDELPGTLRISLPGGPALHAVRSASGVSLPASSTLDVALGSRLVPRGRVRLRAINGRGADERGTVPHDGLIRLSFTGVVDPASVTPGNCPLFPIAEGLQLKPLLPETRWSLVGSRCEVLLEVPVGSGPLELVWKRLGLRGLDGAPSEGPLVVTLSSS